MTHSSEDKPKVALITAEFPPSTSGGADYALLLGQHLAERNLEVHVITTKRDRSQDAANMRIHAVARDWGWRDLAAVSSVLHQIDPDVINLHFSGFLYNDHPMITMLPLIARRRFAKARFVTLFEAAIGTRAYLQPRLIRYLHRAMSMLPRGVGIDYSFGALLSHSDNIIVLSKAHADFLSRSNSNCARRISLIPVPPLAAPPKSSLSKTAARQRWGLSPNDWVICYLGYIYPGKGLETLLEAVAGVQQLLPCKLLVCGGTSEVVLRSMDRHGYKESLIDKAEQLGISEKIIFTGGFDTYSDVPANALIASDIVVLPFEHGVHLNNSTFSTAASFELPIITTYGADTEELFRPGTNVLMCPPNDHAALSEAIHNLSSDAKLRKQLARSAKSLADRYLNWDFTVDQTLRVFFGESVEELRA